MRVGCNAKAHPPSSPSIPIPAADDLGEGSFDLSRWDDEIGGVAIAGEHDCDLLADLKEAAVFLRSKAAGDYAPI